MAKYLDETGLNYFYGKLKSKLDLKANISDVNGSISDIQSSITNEVSRATSAENTLSSRMDTFTNLPSGSTSGDAELIDIRVGYDGFTYSSAGTAVRSQINSLENKVDSVASADDTNFLLGVVWASGGIKTDGTDIANTARIRTNYIDIPDNITSISFSVATNYKYVYYLYSSDYTVIGTNTYWATTTTTAYVPSNAAYARITVAKSNDATISISEGVNMHAAYVSYIVDKVKRIIDLDSESLLSGAWVSGGIKVDGTDIVNSQRIRTDYINVSGGGIIETQIDSGYKYLWYFYNSLNAVVSYQPSWLTENRIIEVPDTAVRLRFCMCNSVSSDISPTAGSNLHINYSMPIVAKVNALSDYCFGEGNSLYYGERVNLIGPTTVNKCNTSEWLSVTQYSVPDMSNYAFWTNQSMAIYNGFVFVLFNGGSGVVFDYETKTIIGTISGYTDSNHQNSAQFTKYFYDQNDDFPLIAISRYGNIGETTGKDQCLLMRIQKNGTIYNFTLVNTIEFESHTYGNSWGIDTNNNTITMLAYINAVYTVTTSNPLFFYTWKMPSLSEILGGTPITLTESDCLYKVNTPYGILQAIYCMNGKAYIASYMIGVSGAFVIDLATGEILTKIPISGLTEAEGIAIYNSKLYVSNRKGETEAEENPMTIYEVEF